MNDWYCRVGEKQYGPISEQTLLIWISEKRVQKDSLVWKTGMSNWREAGAIKPFSNAFPITRPTFQDVLKPAEKNNFTRNQYQNVDSETFRAHNEKVLLFTSLTVLAVVFFLLLGLSFGFVLILVLFFAVLVKVQQGQLLGQAIRVTENQFPNIHNLITIAANRLKIKPPEVFVTQNPVINAYALGFLERKSVVLYSATIEFMSEEELLFVLGHEFTHIKCNHTDWRIITGSVEGIGIPVISNILNFIFLFWSRKTEYTSDRGALIACKDLKPSISALAKISVGKYLFEKMDLDNLFFQKIEVDNDLISKLSESLSTHPYVLNRILEIKNFYDSNIYREIVVDNPHFK